MKIADYKPTAEQIEGIKQETEKRRKLCEQVEAEFQRKKAKKLEGKRKK